jgi:transposase InsO family protein
VPWKEKTVEMNREEFVRRVLAKEKSKSSLCREYGISRPTGDKWIKRYEAGDGINDRSRAPFHTANRISVETEELIVEARKKEPGIGATKIHRILCNAGYTGLPSISTVNAVFKRNNLITPEASLAATPYKRFEKESPNVMWQVDFKGHYAMRNGQRCHPLSVLDDHSRYCLCADAKMNEQREGVEESFKKVFREYGMPQSLLCDNGNPWGASQSGAYTMFELWLMDLGILTIHIRPRHPQTQGKNERFNGSFKQERLKFYVPYDLADADRQRSEYREFYNNVRPHHALGLDVPAQHYEPSKREFIEEPKEWEYGTEYGPRKIKSSGYLTYDGQGYFLSEAFGGRMIGIKLSSIDGFANLYYRQFKIGRVNLKERAVVSRRCYMIEGDPREEGIWGDDFLE